MNMTMKNFLIVLLLTGLIACDTTESKIGLSETERAFYSNKAWEQLAAVERESITTPVSEALTVGGYLTSDADNIHLVILEVLSHPITYITPFSRLFENGTRIVAVSFNTTDDALLGPITVLLLEENGLLVGFIPRLD